MDTSTDDNNPKYRLVAEINGHDGPVRALCTGTQGQIISGSQDATVKWWEESVPMAVEAESKDSDNNSVHFIEAGIVLDHSHWVTALSPLPPGVLEECPGGGFVTGSLDKDIRIYNQEGINIKVLKGHSGGVISFGWTPENKLISGSWDGTAKIWDLQAGACTETLGDHENGVCVLGLPNGDIATGSTGQKNEMDQVVNCKIRIWRNGSVQRAIEDHSGPIRHLTLVGDLGFASTSNDGTVQLRSYEGDTLAVLQHPLNLEGHPTFILQGTSLAGEAGFVSVGDDGPTGGCMVWGMDGTLIQSLPHPKGVWCVTALPNGDFVTGCQDNVIRVFTCDESRYGPEALMVAFSFAYEEALKKGKQGPTSDEVSKLPLWETRHEQQGNRQGMVSLFQKEGKAIAAEWSAVSGTWIEIGEVTGSANAGAIDGVQYDHVFPIEIEQLTGEVVNLEIGYNNGQNPFLCAQEFIDKHMLPQSHLAQIADYITKRAQQAAPTLGADTGQGFQGGFTGVGVPGGSQFASPMPGSGASAGLGARHFPKQGYLVYDTVKLTKVEPKLMEFNDQLPEGTSLDSKEKESIAKLVQTLGATSRYHVSTVQDKEVLVILKILREWPIDKVFPAIDILRVVMIHPDGSEKVGKGSHFQNIIDIILQRAMEGKEEVAISLLTLRFLCNSLKVASCRAAILQSLSNVLDCVSDHMSSPNKNIRSAVATLLLNVSVALNESCTAPENAISQILAVIQVGLSNTLEDETIFRILVTVGTLLQVSATKEHVRSCLKDLEIDGLLKGIQQKGDQSQKVAECTEDILKFI